jgi:hypothetical protein
MAGEGSRVRVVEDAEGVIRDLRALLAEEVKRREAAEAELAKLKEGSITMMKYVTNLQRKKHDEELQEMKQENKDLRARKEAPRGRIGLRRR